MKSVLLGLVGVVVSLAAASAQSAGSVVASMERLSSVTGGVVCYNAYGTVSGCNTCLTDNNGAFVKCYVNPQGYTCSAMPAGAQYAPLTCVSALSNCTTTGNAGTYPTNTCAYGQAVGPIPCGRTYQNDYVGTAGRQDCTNP